MIIDTDRGALQGCKTDGAVAFLGIPYAAPPIGVARFRPPQPVPAWAGVRPADTYGPAAAQVPSRGRFDDVGETSEDCLYLNVWTPSIDDGRRPVLVWFHGGGLRGGGATEAVSNGSWLAAQHDCVVVSVGYRLGALGGFVWLAQIGDARLEDSANLGLLDQLAALRWVHEHAERFGGDPSCVTIFGQSSGGQSVAMLLSMPESTGLVHRAIAESPAQPVALEPEVADHLLQRYLSHLDARGVSAAQVYDAPARELVAAVSDLKKETDWGEIGHPIHPILDGGVLRRQPLEALASGQARDIPLLVGWNRDELTLNFGADVPSLPFEQLLVECRRPFPEPGTAERMARAYCADAIDELDPHPPGSWTFLNGDRMVRVGANRLLDAQAAHQPNTYAYALCWDPPSGRGSVHCLEIPLVFGTSEHSAWGRFTGTGAAVEAMTRRVQAAWTSFARTGVPRADGLPPWPRFDGARRPTMLLGDRPRVADDVWPVQRRAWDGVS